MSHTPRPRRGTNHNGPQEYAAVPQSPRSALNHPSGSHYKTRPPTRTASVSSHQHQNLQSGRGAIAAGVATGAIGGGYGPYSYQPDNGRDAGVYNASRFSSSPSEQSMLTGADKPPVQNTSTVPQFLWDKDPDLDDALHNPDIHGRGDNSFTMFSARGWANASALFVLIIGLLMLFAGYPILLYYNHPSPRITGFNLGGINGSGQIPDLPGLPRLIDPTTPDDVLTRIGSDGKKYDLVFSDEFNTDGRTFFPGDDPFWEAVDLHYWPTGDLEWYSPEALTTEDGKLVITLTQETFNDLNFKSGMLQSWNKLCYNTGYVEVSVSLPGSPRVPGLWPGVWSMGNLGRAGYGATNEGMWPYSYDSCDLGTFPNQTAQDGTPEAVATGSPGDGPLSFLPGQRLSACTCPGSDHPGPKVSNGRGVPEIDILEAQIDVSIFKGEVSQSFQCAPYNYKYEFDTSSPATTIYDTSKTAFNTYKGGVFQQAVSAVTLTEDENYGGQGYGTYGYEWYFDQNRRQDSYITWYSTGEKSWTITSETVGPDSTSQISGRLIPEEPMYLVLNLGIAPGFQKQDYKHLEFPAKIKEDRGQTKALHGYGERGTMPPNRRDASGSSGLWKNPRPTNIDPPRNHTRSGQHDYSPWTAHSMGNNAGRRQSGNQTANRTMTSSLPPPRKKQKTAHRATSGYFDNGPQYVMGRGTPIDPKTAVPRKHFARGPEVINLDDEDEDKGIALMSTPDRLDVLDCPPSEKVLKARKPSPPRFRQQPIDVDDEDDLIPYDPGAPSGSRIVSDRDEAKTLQVLAPEESDPITQYSPSPPRVPSPKIFPNVQTMVQTIEQQQQQRHLDLRQYVPSTHKKKGVKNSMKGKNPSTTEPRDAVATKSTNFTSSSVAVQQPGVKKMQLRIKEWFFGTDHRRDGPTCFLSWERETLRIMEEGMRTPVLSLAVRSEVGSVEYSEPSDFTVIMLTTLMPTNKRRFNLPNNGRFRMGDRHAGNVTVMFDDQHEDWSTANYSTFVTWIKGHVNDSGVLRTGAAQKMWEASMTQSELGDTIATRQQRQKADEAQSGSEIRRPSKRPAPDDESTPPPVGDLSSGPSSHGDASASSSCPDSRIMISQHSGTSNSGIATAPRRSARRHASPRRLRSPSPDSDEVILCYPRGIPGAVNINNADLKRLQPGEFLNDTLIEFGLKLWLRRLEESNPELARQIHVFSSFFYKKLHQKNMDEGYESVRKWTAKIDIFSKKYIIVPINENFHWYLVIIYQPEHVLIPPPIMASPATRGRKNVASTRVSPAKPASTEKKLASIFTKPTSTSSKPPSITTQLSSTEKPLSMSKPLSSKKPPSSGQSSKQEVSPSSEAEVEEVVMEGMGGLLNFEASCSITITTVDSTSVSRATSVIEESANASHDDTVVPESPPTDMDVEENNLPAALEKELSMTISDYESSFARSRPAIHDIDMDDVPSASTSRQDADSLFGDENDAADSSKSVSVQPHIFYGKSQKASGKQKAIPNQAVFRKDDFPVTVDEQGPDEEPLTSSPNSDATTYIFTFDSLGSRHPQAIKLLSRYLKKEAQDKLNKTDLSDAVGKQALVPVQPNFCDCGLYLLHFAETFMSDPERYCQVIKARSKGTMNLTRQDDWKAELTGDMRERLADEIKQLSVEWKQERTMKEEAKRKEAAERTGPIELAESSDDEVDIVETIPAVTTAKKGAKGNVPVRGKAMRPRG
ncbi:hypothetical protein D9615_003013 [Tricholomella constricta]|uniref:Ubiquitin-like protease family profile domain-containing protein n=1 Tax=Tricholomella constricta TaxID=117010 RepID=A0A8H5HFV7_9AGAR|nr:hypothetical protein D9615_003013 [Tricholomella constricta]